MKFVDLHKKIKIAYSTFNEGNIDQRYSSKKELKENRKNIFKEFGIKTFDVIEAQQVHGTLILPLNEENSKMWRGKNVTGIDGFVIDQTDVALMLRVADCVPVVMYDPNHHVMGLFHVGWRGATKDYHLAGLETLIAHYETKPRSVLVWLGPSAQDCCYASEKKPDQTTNVAWKKYIKKRNNTWWVNIPGYITETLLKAGVLKKNINSSSVCTVESEEMFSYQLSKADNKNEGRFAVLVQLK